MNLAAQFLKEKAFVRAKAKDILLVPIFFPWVGFNLLSTDSQPWPIIFGFLLIFLARGRVIIPAHIITSFILMAIGATFSLWHTADILSSLVFRSIFSYISFFVVFVSFYGYLNAYGFPGKIVDFVLWIWITGGVIEVFAPGSLSFFLEARGSSERGVASLSPEPTFFGITLLLLSYLKYASDNYSFRSGVKFHLICVLGIIFLAKSSMATLLLLVTLAMLFLVKFGGSPLKAKLMMTLILSVFLFILFVSLSLLLDGTRLNGILLGLLNYGPSAMLESDGSINERVEHVFVSYYLFINNMRPMGFDTFVYAKSSLGSEINSIFWYSGGFDKIMSWSGDFVYQLGIFGFFAISILFVRCFSSGVFVFAFFVTLLSAVPVANSIVPLIFATGCYLKRQRKLLRHAPNS